MSPRIRPLKTWGRTLLSLLLLSGGTALTVVGSQGEVALLVVGGVVVIFMGLGLLKPLAQGALDWIDRKGL